MAVVGVGVKVRGVGVCEKRGGGCYLVGSW